MPRKTPDGIAEGFERQRLLVVPEFRSRQVATLPILRDLRITALGQFWEAKRHFVTRPKGAAEHIWIYCLAGRGGAELGGKQHVLGAGDLIVLPARKAHRYFADPEIPWTIFWFHVTGERALDHAAALGLDLAQPVLHAPATDELQRAFEDIHRHALDGFTGAGMLAVATGFIRMVGMFRLGARSRSERVRGSEDRLAEVVDAIQQHLLQPWTVSAMAASAAMSVAHFSELFKARAGMSPMAYVIHLRMQRAAALLQWDDAPVSEVAARVGYDDAYYFSRLFRSVFGVSPRAYRKHLNAGR
ncbi:AraC family transcriptional regulator [Haloferula sp. BvORR071]|uniref:AraC family transcriptional regulator n=1 Tax=Haloferula sp. BvORR071 TaxID=1396141 RepID=UPI002240E900|nr:AraC family transcriptional regulator [Haloferula sp. BvORR071]